VPGWHPLAPGSLADTDSGSDQGRARCGSATASLTVNRMTAIPADLLSTLLSCAHFTPRDHLTISRGPRSEAGT
jgi:hypothetical protein